MGKLSAGFDLATELRAQRTSVSPHSGRACDEGRSRRNGRCERWSKGAAPHSWHAALEPSGFVCRAGTSRVAQRSACASRRFAAAAGSRRRPSRARSA